MIELSIGVVIVCLFAGGALVAGTIVEAGKVDKLARKLLQYESAALVFKQKYGFYASDSAAFEPAGNENGVIEPIEAQHFWLHMSSAGLAKYDSKTYNAVKADFVKNITPAKASAEQNLSFQLTLKPTATLLLEKKITVKSALPSQKSVGLYNLNGIGNCIGENGDIKLCEEENVDSDKFGELAYFISTE